MRRLTCLSCGDRATHKAPLSGGSPTSYGLWWLLDLKCARREEWGGVSKLTICDRMRLRRAHSVWAAAGSPELS